METPTTTHLNFQDVYEPSEDTFLLMDCIEDDLTLLRSLNPCLCVEVGSGSGVISSAVCHTLGLACLTVDINPKACTATRATAERHGVSGRLDAVCSDLLSPMVHRLHGKVDVLIFNPPYVPTDSEEIQRSSIARAWAGGLRGREVTDRLLPHVSSLLSPQGVFYLLLLQQNNPQEIQLMLQRHNLFCKTMRTKTGGGESLLVMRVSKVKLSDKS